MMNALVRGMVIAVSAIACPLFATIPGSDYRTALVSINADLGFSVKKMDIPSRRITREEYEHERRAVMKPTNFAGPRRASWRFR